MLFFAVFKPYFLPSGLRQVLKIGILIGVFLFLVTKSSIKKLINCSLIFCTCILLSSLIAKVNGNYPFKSLFDSVLYALTFYDLYTFTALCKREGYFDALIKCLYKINLLYCVFNSISIFIVGVENNSNSAVYLFGNKFTSMYLFILLITLYASSCDMRRKRNRAVLLGLFAFSIFLSLYLGCATASVTLSVLLILCFVPNRIQQRLVNERVVVIILTLSALIIIWIEIILQYDFVNALVTDYFNKSYTVSGRLKIYGFYIGDIIRKNPWFGYGYSNSVMKDTTGVFANAQNGLLEILVSFGFVGVLAVLITVYYCYKKSTKGNKTFYLSLVVYGMIIAAIFEITINWFFLLGICLVRWNCEKDENDVPKKIRVRLGGR